MTFCKGFTQGSVVPHKLSAPITWGLVELCFHWWRVGLCLFPPPVFCVSSLHSFTVCLQEHFRSNGTNQLHFPLLLRFRGTVAQCCSEGGIFLHPLYDACENLGPIQKVLGYFVSWKRAENWFLTLLWPWAASQPRSQRACGCVFVFTHWCLTVLQGKVKWFMVSSDGERGCNSPTSLSHWYMPIFYICILFLFPLAHVWSPVVFWHLCIVFPLKEEGRWLWYEIVEEFWKVQEFFNHLRSFLTLRRMISTLPKKRLLCSLPLFMQNIVLEAL